VTAKDVAAKTTATVLVVDDDPAVGKVLGALLRQDGLEAEHVASGAEALQALEARPFEVVVTDVRMPGMDGMELLDRVKRRWPELPVVVLTAFGSVELGVEAMKAGAADFITKPFDREQILAVIRKELRAGRRFAEAAPPPPARREAGLIGDSPAMQGVYRMIERAATSDATVLIRGESGTGKELVVQAIHRQGARREGPLVTVHCAALPATLLEAELFGHEKGAFTGATTRKPGRVELAGGGTLFLDEIGDIEPAVQVKLLRLLQEKQYERLGGTQTLTADVRFVAATHQDLEAMLAQGTFREDLFYRLNVIPVELPPLRERGQDVALLARHFCDQVGEAAGRRVPLTDEAVALLCQQVWPGNVRQLQNLVERLVVLADGPTIDAASVAAELPGGGAGAPAQPGTAGAAGAAPAPGRTLDELVHETVRQALITTLERCNNNRSQAARVLGISRRTLYNKLREHGLE
jgi:DNA-binding NtrC family response regulator